MGGGKSVLVCRSVVGGGGSVCECEGMWESYLNMVGGLESLQELWGGCEDAEVSSYLQVLCM